MTEDDQNSVCPGSCNAKHGQGTCDESTRKCDCILGWTGVDCGEATCCPVYVFLIVGVIAFLSIGAYISWRVARRCGCVRSEEVQQDPEKDGKEKGKKGKKRSSVAKSDVEAGTPNSDSRIGIVSDVILSPGHASPTLQRAATGLSAGPSPTLRRNQSFHSGAESNTSKDGLRTSAWGTESPSSAMGQAQNDPRPAGKPGLRRAQTEAFGHSRTDTNGTSSAPTSGMGHAKTDAAGGASHASGKPSPLPFDRSKSEPEKGSGSMSLPCAVFDDATSPHVKAVHDKLRDMMDRPILERKKTFKDLLVENHPDKNSDEHAKEVFQAVNNARTWFLHEAQPDSKAAA